MFTVKLSVLQTKTKKKNKRTRTKTPLKNRCMIGHLP